MREQKKKRIHKAEPKTQSVEERFIPGDRPPDRSEILRLVPAIFLLSLTFGSLLLVFSIEKHRAHVDEQQRKLEEGQKDVASRLSTRTFQELSHEDRVKEATMAIRIANQLSKKKEWLVLSDSEAIALATGAYKVAWFLLTNTEWNDLSSPSDQILKAKSPQEKFRLESLYQILSETVGVSDYSHEDSQISREVVLKLSPSERLRKAEEFRNYGDEAYSNAKGYSQGVFGFDLIGLKQAFHFYRDSCRLLAIENFKGNLSCHQVNLIRTVFEGHGKATKIFTGLQGKILKVRSKLMKQKKGLKN